MAASLFTIGNTYLGNNQPKLSELNSTDSKTRVWADSSDYKRVNSNEEAENHCPSPSDASGTSGTSQPATGAANSLAKWEGYVQWNTTSPYINAGEDFDITSRDGGASSTTGTAVFTWDRPGGYTTFTDGSMTDVTQEIWVRPCGTGTEDCDNPAGSLGGPAADVVNDVFGHVSAVRTIAGDDATDTVGNLTENTWYVAAVRTVWNDTNNNSVPNNATQGHTAGTSSPYIPSSSVGTALSNPAQAVGNGDSNAIIFKSADFIPCTTITPGLSTIAGNTGACDACDNWNISGNRTTVQVNHTGFLSGKVLYTNGQSCASGQEISHKWASNDGQTAYTVKSSPAGQIGSPTVDCTDTNICEGF